MNRRNAIEKSMKDKGKAMKKTDDKKDKMEEVQQVDEVVGALVGGAVGSKVLPGLIGKAAPGFAASGIGKALTSKAAGAAIGAGAGEMLDPFKKGKNKKPLQAAIGGGVAGAAASKVADLAAKIPSRTPPAAVKTEHHQKDADGKVIEHDELEEGKKGLYANIHAKRKRGEAPAKPGDKDYPAKDAFKKAAKTAKKEEVEVDESLKQARKNVGASTCWDGYKAKGTKMKGGKKVPNCVKEFSEWRKLAEKK